jgi:hypothetical protein
MRYRLPDGSGDQPDETGGHTATVNVMHSAAQYQRFPGCPECRGIAQFEDPARQAMIAAATADIHPVLDRVDIRTDPADGHLSVWTVWQGVDRPCTAGMSVRTRGQAGRLRAAILAGVAVTVEGVGIDVNGQTYVREQWHVLGRRLNADLTKLGF